MDKDQHTPDTEETTDREPDPRRQTTPRGNQPAEQEWVDRGEEQLEKVSGN